MIIPGIIAGQASIEELYISSELYPIPVRDDFTVMANIEGLNYLNKTPEPIDYFSVSGSVQGSHLLTSVRQNYDVYDTDTYTLAGTVEGNHDLVTVRQDYNVYDTDTYTLAGSMSGNHALTVVRIDYDVYDTDTYTLAGSMQGNHTLT